MELIKPPLAAVDPGQPVTAQGWNEILTGVSDLFDAVLAFGTGVVQVNPLFDGTPVADATVIATPADGGQPVRAVPPYEGRSTHSLVGLSSGTWTVHTDAPGFAIDVRSMTVPTEATLQFDMSREGVVVPDLFGVGLRAAIDALRSAGLDTDMILDTTGKELPRSTVPPEYVEAPVLDQSPAPGDIARPGALRVRLVVASALRRDPVVTMPSLVGLTATEASRVLEQLGLTVGRTTFQNRN